MQHYKMSKKVMIVLAVMCALLYAALNQTVIGTITPHIVSDLGGMEHLSWIFTLFMLTSAVATAIAGRLSDQYGRKRLVVAGLALLMVGSALCGFSRTFWTLVLFRGLQGMGVGIIIAMSFTIVGDLFVPRERGRWLGVVTSVYGIASLCGPVLGGYVADHSHWRWAFWMFLPVGAAALGFVGGVLPSLRFKADKALDYVGTFWLATAIVLLMLGFSLGGTYLNWSSPIIIGLLILSVFALAIFIRTEKRAAYPIMPLPMFNNRTYTLASLIGLASSVCMFGTIMYAPLYLQGVLGLSAAMSGALVMPLTLGLVSANSAAGWLVSRSGRYRKLALCGLAVMTLGMLGLSMMAVGSSLLTVMLCMAVFGIGLGTVLSVFTLISQSAVDTSLLGSATSSFQLFRQLGATIGLSVMGTVLQHRLGQHDSDVERLSYALQGVFQIGLSASVMALLLGLCMIEIPLRSAEASNTE